MLKKCCMTMLIAGALFATQAGAVSDWGRSSEASWSHEFAGSEQITVFNPDGSSYSIVPVEVEIATFVPLVLTAANEPLPEHLTVFEPSGLVYSYEFTPVEQVTMAEPIDVVAMADEPVILSDEDADLRPTYVVYYVSSPIHGLTGRPQ